MNKELKKYKKYLMLLDAFFLFIYRGFYFATPFVGAICALIIRKFPRTRQVFKSLGLKIPTKCPFKAKYDLPFTPCLVNPFFPWLAALAIWARQQDRPNTVETLLNTLKK